MKQVSRILALAGIATALTLGTGTALAQQGPPGGGRGNFDPAQMRQRMMERMREQLEVTNDAEWKLIEERLTKVTEAQRDARAGGGFGRAMFGGGQRQRGGNQAQQNAQRQRGPFGGEPMPEAEALQKAIEDKASSEVIKPLLAKYRTARKAKEAELAKAQNALREVLSVRQEAQCVMMGMLE